MAKLPRVTLTQFGNAGPISSFGQFGSKEAGTPQTTKDPVVIQQLSAWVQGWQNAVVNSDKAAYLEDMNGWCFVQSYMTAYIFQMGIPEYDSGTTYFLNSVVQDAVGNGQWFLSLQDNNAGNTPPAGASNAFWLWINPPEYVVGASATLNTLPKVTNTAPSTGIAGSKTLGDSAVSDNGINVIISLPLKFPDNTVQSTAAQSTSVSGLIAISSFPLNQTYLHGLSGTPNFYSVSIQCVSGELGFSIGDEVVLSTKGAGSESMSIYANATLVGISCNSIHISTQNGVGGASITSANWKFVFRARM